MTQFEAMLLEEVDRIRTEFQLRDLPFMYFTIEASGRANGELNIKFRVDGDYDSRAVEGDSVDAALEEFFRRTEWKKRHNALLLPAVKDTNTTSS